MKKVYILIIIFIVSTSLILVNSKFWEEEEKVNNLVIPEENYEEDIVSEVILYFLDLSNNIVSETRYVEAKDLINKPYEFVLNLLKNEEETETRKNILNKEFEIIETVLNNDILEIVVSSNFFEIYKENNSDAKELMKKTVIQFKEISDIIIKDKEGNVL